MLEGDADLGKLYANLVLSGAITSKEFWDSRKVRARFFIRITVVPTLLIKIILQHMMRSEEQRMSPEKKIKLAEASGWSSRPTCLLIPNSNSFFITRFRENN